MITIYRSILEEEQGVVFVYFRETAQGVTGPIVSDRHEVLPTHGDTPLAAPDWANADLEVALAARLGIDATLISTEVYEPPVIIPEGEV